MLPLCFFHLTIYSTTMWVPGTGSGYQAWWQPPKPDELSCQTSLVLLKIDLFSHWDPSLSSAFQTVLNSVQNKLFLICLDFAKDLDINFCSSQSGVYHNTAQPGTMTLLHLQGFDFRRLNSAYTIKRSCMKHSLSLLMPWEACWPLQLPLV